jgi:predicted transcriptional regulator
MSVVRTRARGELEGGIMRILWEAQAPLSAKDIQDAFDGHTPAYTTLLTALDRLQKKGRVLRSGDSPRKVRFEAAHAEDEHAGEAMISALDEASDRQAALLRFAGNLDARDVEVLRRAIGAEGSRAGGRKR